MHTATLGGIIVSPDNSAPEIANPQLLRSDDINPIIETTNGFLAGAIVRGDGSTVWILSDPDLLSNHGLLRGNNAALALTIVKRLVRPGGAVIVDETLHGFRLEPNLIRALFQLPFVVATIVFVASVGVLLWAVIGRFGAPMTQPATRVAGKSTLVDNIAVLLGASGNRIEILRRFLSQTTRDVARIFHVPHHLPDDRRTAWLDRVGKARSVTDSLPDLEMAARVLGRRKKLNERQIIDLAARAFRWRQEMMHGPERSPNR